MPATLGHGPRSVAMQYEKPRRAWIPPDGMRHDHDESARRQHGGQVEEQRRKDENDVEQRPPDVYIKRRVRLEEPWRGYGR
jgi:hypothetical protein